MNKTKFCLSILTIITLLVNLSISKEHTTSLSYVYKYEVKPTQEVAEVIFYVSNKNYLLSSCYQYVDSIVDKISKLAEYYCSTYNISDKKCNVTLEIINEQTYTLSKVLNNKMLFSMPKMSHIWLIKYTKYLQMPPWFLSIGCLKMYFYYNQQQEDKLYEEAIKLGVQYGFKLCEQIDGELYTVIRVEYIADFEVQDFYGEYEPSEDEPYYMRTLSDEELTKDYGESNYDEKPTIYWKYYVLCKIK